VLDCLVVGAGPAGLTAALYLRRFGRHVLLADEGHSRAEYIDRCHNFPGFPQGIAGADPLLRMRRQLHDVGGEVTQGRVSGLQQQADGSFNARLDARRLRSRTVLLATCVVDRVPPVAGIEAVRADGLLRQCPICDGHEHRGTAWCTAGGRRRQGPCFR
jgi:thioredoxin reductase (NADPH)